MEVSQLHHEKWIGEACVAHGVSGLATWNGWAETGDMRANECQMEMFKRTHVHHGGSRYDDALQRLRHVSCENVDGVDTS